MEEKKARLLRFFQDEYSFYNMKELEKLIPKKCAGVSPMIVKDLVQQMIDEDGLVMVEKCGNINVYWCFKNQIIQKIYDNCQELVAKSDLVVQEITELKKRLHETRETDRCMLVYDTHGSLLFNREEQLERNKEVSEQVRVLQAKYSKISQTRWSEKKISEKRTYIMNQLDRIESCTDDIEIIIEYLSKRYQIEVGLIKKELEIPEEFDEFDIQFCSI